MSKTKKVILVIVASVIIVLLLLGLTINYILGSYASDSINTELEKINTTKHMDIHVEKVKFNVFSTTVIIKGVKIRPDSATKVEFKNGNAGKPSYTEFNIADIRLRGIDVLKLLLDKQFSLNIIAIKDVEFNVFKSNFNPKAEVKKEEKSTFVIDSIFIKGFSKIELGEIKIEGYSFNTFQIEDGELLSSYKGNEFEIRGIRLDSYDDAPGYFKINTEDLNLKLRRQRFDLPGGDYFVYFDKLDFNYSDSVVNISDLKFKPTKDKFKLAASYKYTKEVFDVEIGSLDIHGYKVGEAIKKGVVDIDSIIVDKLNIAIFKDKHQPWDYNKRPLFLQQKLKSLKFPLHIDKVIVKDSKLKYSDRAEGSDKLMIVDITKMSAEVIFVTSIKDSLRSGKNLTLNLQGKLMDVSSMNLDIIMPYNSRVDTFYYSGSLGKAQFVKFNQAIYPATGIKFVKGKLNSVEFSATASPKGAKGQMTMLYTGLEAEVTKKEVDTKSKALTWLANTVVPQNNPSNKGKTTVAIMEVDRVEYKGLGNLIWKSVQSGLVNTINPVGKVVKDDKGHKKTNKKSVDNSDTDKSEKKKKGFWRKKNK